MKKSKPTVAENVLEIELKELRKKDKGKVLLRINATTQILVEKENCTKEYAEQYAKLINTSLQR